MATARERATILKKAIGTLKETPLPKEPAIKEALARSVMSGTEMREHITDKELLLRLRREKVYTSASLLKSWFQQELQLLTQSSKTRPELKHFCVENAKAAERAEKVSKAFGQRTLFQEVATNHLSEILKVLAKRLIEIRGDPTNGGVELDALSEQELEKFSSPEVKLVIPQQGIADESYFRDKRALRKRQQEIADGMNKPWLKQEADKKRLL